MKKIIYFLAMIINIQFYSCENSVESKEVPFEISMLYPNFLTVGDTLSVVLKFAENDTTINTTDDIRVYISNKVLYDTLSVFGLLKRNGDKIKEIGNYKNHGIDLITGYGVIVQGVFLKGYATAFDLEVVIGNKRVKSKEKLGIIQKRKI